MSPRERLLPGYWTPQEIAEELGKSTKWVVYFIKGRYGRPPELNAYQVYRLYFVPDADAEAFLRRHGSDESSSIS